jgi:chromosome segregation ATPase
MEQMFMQSSSFITNFLTHLNNEIMDLKKKLANYEYDLIFAKKELQKQKDKYKDLTYKYKDLQTKHNFEKWKIGEQIKKFENLFNKHKKEFSYEVTKVSKEITYWKKEVKVAKKAYNMCESETKQLKNILKISRDNMTKFGQPKLDLSEKSLLPKKKIVKKAVDFLINLFNKKNETAGN